jgi:hypothetical protein
MLERQKTRGFSFRKVCTNCLPTDLKNDVMDGVYCVARSRTSQSPRSIFGTAVSDERFKKISGETPRRLKQPLVTDHRHPVHDPTIRSAQGHRLSWMVLATPGLLTGARVIEYALNESLIIDTCRRRRACEILNPFQRRVGIRLNEHQFAGRRKPQIQPSGASNLQ